MKIHVTAVSRVNKNSQTLNNYTTYIRDIISDLPDTSILVLPEYCWGSIGKEEFDQVVNDLQHLLSRSQQALLGTYPHMIAGEMNNCAIYINPVEKILIPKSHVLQEERKRNQIVDGINTGVIQFNGINIAVVICADLWDISVFQHFLPTADILLVPAMTTVEAHMGSYARYQWYSLTITRSREFIVPIVVADHAGGTNSYDVGAATAIANPSWKNKTMQSIEDFLVLPDDGIISETLDLQRVREYKEYRRQKGLYHY